jgi:hypothetical protein
MGWIKLGESEKMGLTRPPLLTEVAGLGKVKGRLLKGRRLRDWGYCKM